MKNRLTEVLKDTQLMVRDKVAVNWLDCAQNSSKGSASFYRTVMKRPEPA